MIAIDAASDIFNTRYVADQAELAAGGVGDSDGLLEAWLRVELNQVVADSLHIQRQAAEAIDLLHIGKLPTWQHRPTEGLQADAGTAAQAVVDDLDAAIGELGRATGLNELGAVEVRQLDIGNQGDPVLAAIPIVLHLRGLVGRQTAIRIGGGQIDQHTALLCHAVVGGVGTTGAIELIFPFSTD